MLGQPNPSAPEFAFNLRFPGQYFDAETGKHYNYYRDNYDPSIGRYGQSDPIGLLAGLNTYGYVSADPLALFDELGLAQCSYSISRHSLSCQPNPGTSGSGVGVNLGPGGLFSGAGPCKDNPSEKCQNTKNRWPIPEGDYDMVPYDGPNKKGNDWWRLKPTSLVRKLGFGTGSGRGGHLLHPGSISLGCITYSGPKEDYDRLNDLLRSNGPNTLNVSP
jgi:RHS repeat-associated protein